MRILLAASCIIVAALASTARAEPRYELATNPLAVVNEDYTVSLAGEINPHIVLRGEVELNTAGVRLDQASGATALGVRLYLAHAFSGPFVEPGIIARSLQAAGMCTGSDGSVTDTCFYPTRTLGPEIFAGWQWTYASQFSATAAVGIEKAWATDNGLSAAAIPRRLDASLRVGYLW